MTLSSLPTLTKRVNEILSEMRQLGSERQSLMYNHHHESIAASNTVAATRTLAESLDVGPNLLKLLSQRYRGSQQKLGFMFIIMSLGIDGEDRDGLDYRP
ncbi:hypothetical protein JAAARDRAFT_38750 [Jaapia argillacea MUCL 33604]|uniref:Uncharacterized protein n=1 Tax=Jaapia argillacea MUCL 33604 TaxID=933084 RepID=A0A067PS52_9AGAM|nr:hypothetical protein JAAARDRAFT_38750 [Jaapia argillacea MUCL 33604]